MVYSNNKIIQRIFVETIILFIYQINKKLYTKIEHPSKIHNYIQYKICSHTKSFVRMSKFNLCLVNIIEFIALI